MKFRLLLPNPSRPTNSVQLVTFINRERIKIGTGVAVPTDQWDSSSQKIKAGNDKSLVALQSELEKAVHQIVMLHNQLTVMDDDELTAAGFREAVARMRKGLKGASVRSLSLNQWVDELMDQVESGKRFTPNGTALTIGAIKRYRVVHRLIADFRNEKFGNRQIKFQDVNVQFVNEWKRWRAEGATLGRRVLRKPVTANVIRNDMKMLRMWMKESCHLGLHENRIWETDVMKMKEVQAVVFHLTPEELDKLEKANFKALRKGTKGPKSTAHETVRDMFLMACWTGGRIGDVRRYPEIVMTAWNENGGKCPDSIHYVQTKTNSKVIVPLLPMAKRIIQKHQGALPKMPNDAKVNQILKEVVKAAGISRTIQLVNASIDRQSARIGKIEDLVSFHSGRRSFATNVYNMGVLSLGELRALTGHKTEAMLMRYLNVTQTEVSERATARLLEAFKGS